MTAREFVKSIWICEPPIGTIKTEDVFEAMEEYAEYKIKEFIHRMPVGDHDCEP